MHEFFGEGRKWAEAGVAQGSPDRGEIGCAKAYVTGCGRWERGKGYCGDDQESTLGLEGQGWGGAAWPEYQMLGMKM